MPTERANGAMPLNWDVLNQVTIHLSDSKADLCNFMRTCRTMHSLGMRSLVARYTPHLDIDDSIVGSLRPPQYDVSPDSTSSAWRSTLGFLQMLLQDAPARALLLEVFEFPHTSADKALERRFSTLLSQVLRYSANLNAITLAFGHLLDPQVPPALVSGCVRLQSITLLGETCSDSYAAAVAMFQSARWPLRAISINTATPSPHPILESFATSITELSLAFLDSELGLPRFPSVRTLRLEHPSLIDGVALSAAFPNLAELFVQSDYSHDDDISGNIDGWHYENEDHDAQWSQLDFVQGKTPYVYALAATRHIRRLALDVFIESQTDGDRLQAVLSAAQPVVLSLDIQLDVWNSSAYLGGMWDGLASTSRLKCLALSFYVHEPDMVQHVDFREFARQKLGRVNVTHLRLAAGNLGASEGHQGQLLPDAPSSTKSDSCGWLLRFVAGASSSLVFIAVAPAADGGVEYYEVIRGGSCVPQLRRLEGDEGRSIYIANFS